MSVHRNWLIINLSWLKKKQFDYKSSIGIGSTTVRLVLLDELIRFKVHKHNDFSWFVLHF